MTNSALLSESGLFSSAPLTAEERRQVLVEWNETSADYPSDRSIGDLFEEQAAETPDAIALVFDSRRLTYAELNTQANQLARHLQSLGVGPEVLVAICLDRSIELVVALLAILKAGGAYVPLDPRYPRERLSFMLADTGARVLLTESALLERLPQPNAVRVVLVDADPKQWMDESREKVTSGAGPENLAYVMYTSGSTGQPKGVEVTHRDVVRLVKNNDYISFGPREVFLQLAPVSFDASTLELWGSLLNGARLVVMSAGQPTLEELGAVIAARGVTTLWLTAGLFHLMVDEQLDQLVQVRQLLAGGDVLSVSHVEKYLAALRRAGSETGRLINGYGPTENTTFSCCEVMDAASEVGSSVPIGRPIKNTRAYILDEEMRLVAAGVRGELYLGGDGLARGYLSRPDLTAERFVPDPHSEKPGERLYRTGDEARYLADGRIEFLGRRDGQVKIRGYRIEVGEVETALAAHGEVREVAVIAREDVAGDKRLVAYVVVAGETEKSETELRQDWRDYLTERLPEYLVPSQFVLLKALPLTPNGKLDRKALPAPEPGRDEDESYVGPRNSIERRLAEIWEEALGVERAGVYDNFFALGGHSLKATRIVTRVRQTFNVNLPLQHIFEFPTITESARFIEDYKPEDHGSHANGLRPMFRVGNIPLSYSQERLWFLQKLAPTSRAYHFQATLRFSGPLDASALERSIGEIVHRHEVLRSTFPEKDGRGIQVIHAVEPFSLPLCDLRDLPEDEREPEATRRIEEEMRKQFDLARLPLIRWTLFRLSEAEHVLLHVEHHLLHDGWSFNVFLSELLELYKAFAAGQPSPLAELPIQFADFAIWQRQWLDDGVSEKQLAFWKETLAGSPPVLELPLDHPRPATQSFRGAVQRIDLPAELCDGIRRLSRREGVSLFMAMFAAFLVLLQRYSGRDDIAAGCGIANRRWPETETLIGMIINNVVLRADLSGNPTFRELLQRVRQTTLGAYANQDVPFEKVVDALQPERGLNINPLFQTIFSFHDSPLPDLDLPGLKLQLVEGLSNGSAKFDLSVIVIPRSEQRTTQAGRDENAGITMLWEYSTDIFEAATIARAFAHYETVLAGVIANPARHLLDLAVMGEAEGRRVLVEWNDTAAEYSNTSCIHHLFETQAATTPDAIALIWQDRQLSYHELNARSNQLAHYLQSLGVGPETLVAVCVDRSIEMVIALLAVLKAGGAYVPLDPAYPRERLAFMLADTGSPVLLTQSRLLDHLPEPVGAAGPAVVLLDAEAEWRSGSPENVESAVEAENTAYVIYTSGSTGKPKGVQVSHRALVNLVTWHNRAYGVTASDRATQIAGASFDASVWELWPYLTAGASVSIAEDETRMDPSRLLAWLVERRITLSFLPTPLAEAVLKQPLAAGLSLRAILTGGDQLHRIAGDSLPFKLVNHYGPTENTVVATSAPVRIGSEVDGQPPIGRPIANTRIYLLDKNLQPVPLGIPGELFIGGAGLARGYLNRPELTAAKFIPDPFGLGPGARMYATGDRGRYLPDGQIDFLGRSDEQVKVRGFRIEPGEVEAALNTHEGVRESVVIAREDTPGEKRLVAYVVADDATGKGSELVTTLFSHLKGRLPEYMVPSQLVLLEALPLTPNGKVDRQALPNPERDVGDVNDAFVAPRTPVEEVIAEIWNGVLGSETKLSVHDSFFRVGGHSLLATQVISRVRDALQVELPLRSLFESPTIAEFSQLVEDKLIDELEEMTEEEAAAVKV